MYCPQFKSWVDDRAENSNRTSKISIKINLLKTGFVNRNFRFLEYPSQCPDLKLN